MLQTYTWASISRQVLQLETGGCGLLLPFMGGAGMLVLLSCSGVAVPPLAKHTVQDSLFAEGTQPLLVFAKAAVKKAIKVGDWIMFLIEMQTRSFDYIYDLFLK